MGGIIPCCYAARGVLVKVKHGGDGLAINTRNIQVIVAFPLLVLVRQDKNRVVLAPVVVPVVFEADLEKSL